MTSMQVLRGILLLAISATLLSACVSTEPRLTVPHINLSPENMEFVSSHDDALAFGIDATINESDSLENLAVLPGIRIRGVRPGSAAERAGLRGGDVILAIDGVETNSPDVLTTIATSETSRETLSVEARRGTTVFTTQLPVPTAREAIAPEERYRVDPIKSRAGYRTELLRSGNEQISVARVVEIQPQSPLLGADIQRGDAIVAIDGEAIQSAQDLIDRLLGDYDYGDAITLDVVRQANGSMQTLTRRVELWDPGRRLTGFSLWPLVTYKSDPSNETARLTLLDLWLLSLFSYERNAGERQYRFLTFIRFSTGYGELSEDDGSH